MLNCIKALRGKLFLLTAITFGISWLYGNYNGDSTQVRYTLNESCCRETTPKLSLKITLPGIALSTQEAWQTVNTKTAHFKSVVHSHELTQLFMQDI